jgi:hypothetical protein
VYTDRHYVAFGDPREKRRALRFLKSTMFEKGTTREPKWVAAMKCGS